MRVDYKNQRLERLLAAVNAITATIVAGTFVLLVGFDKPFISATVLHKMQAWALVVFVLEKPIRMFNAVSIRQWFRVWRIEVLLVVAMVLTLLGAGSLRDITIGAYLFIQLVTKGSVGIVNIMARGKSPTRVLIMSFVGLIVAGTGMLMMPRATIGGRISVIDALFTATSATCVTGLVVQDTGAFFTPQGQMTILALIQLGGLGIVLFGAVFALIVGQAFSVRETAAMRQVLSAEGAVKIGGMIGFIFIFTILIEGLGAIAMLPMWGHLGSLRQQWFFTVFHSVSAFCNAGFSLFSDNMAGYRNSTGIYLVICPLIVLGGLGFGVLRNLTEIGFQILRLAWARIRGYAPKRTHAARLTLHSRIVLVASAMLIVGGMLAMVVFERYSFRHGPSDDGARFGWHDGFFQSVSARTAGFNTVDIASMSPAGKAVLIMLMTIGGSPGSTAGGIKTVTLVMLVMVVWVTLRKRTEVEIFGRAIRLAVVSRAITLTVIYIVALIVMMMALTITERNSGFTLLDIAFETASALGTVGLSAGITASLSTAGKLIITMAMLIGRLGPLTLVASLTFNLRPAKYNYPEESVMVG
jgi:trk system potassium uptake protein TrkH